MKETALALRVAAGVFGPYREHFAKLEIRDGDGVPRAAHGRVLDPGEAEREVTAFDGLVDAGPLHLDEPRCATPQATRDPLGDLDVEATDARRIGGVGLHEWRTAFGVAAPHELPTDRALRSEASGEAESEPGDAERAGRYHGT